MAQNLADHGHKHLPANLAVMLFGDSWRRLSGMRGMGKGKLRVSRCSEIKSLFRNGCQELETRIA